MQAILLLLQRWFNPRVILEMRENSYRWRMLRKAHLEKHPECAACGRKYELIVHHIVPVSVDKTREFDPRNLMTLCAAPCHIVFGHFLSYHCYNKHVRRMVTLYRKAFDRRSCLEQFDHE